MKLTIHRGTKEIGGSCVAVECGATKVLIDMGLPLDFDTKSSQEQSEIRQQAQLWAKGADALFISHYHADHYGLLMEMDKSEEVPIYTTKSTAAIFEINSVFSRLCAIPQLQTVKPENPVHIGALTITAYTVDHSAFDACAFLIEGDGKKILYSGDIRTHGKKGILYKRLPSNVDYLLLEGTNIRAKSSSTKSEYNIEKEFVELFKSDSDAINYVWCSGQNIDRLIKIYRAALQSDKIFVADVYVASVLEQVHAIHSTVPSVNTHPSFKVFFPPTIVNKLKKEGNFEKYTYRLNPQINKVTYSEINENPSKYVVIVRPSLLPFLKYIKASKAHVITSIWQRYEEREPTFMEWIKENSYIKKHIHSSGHSDSMSLQNIVSHINPKAIIPIHTENGELYQSHFLNHKIILLEDNHPFDNI